MTRFRGRFWLPFSFLLIAACRGGGDPRADRVSLRARLDADVQVVQLLASADALAMRGKAKDALRIVEETALPMARENAGRAKALALPSPWGKAQMPATSALTADREASVTAYRDALASDDVERVIQAMEAEKSLDLRAQALQTAIDSAPVGGGC